MDGRHKPRLVHLSNCLELAFFRARISYTPSLHIFTVLNWQDGLEPVVETLVEAWCAVWAASFAHVSQANFTECMAELPVLLWEKSHQRELAPSCIQLC